MTVPAGDSPRNGGQGVTDSSDSIIFCFDGPGDTTRRPRPPNVPRGWPQRTPGQQSPPYEQLLDRDRMWGFKEGSMHFEKESAVHKTLEKITRRLGELGIPYVIIGAMAMFFHGLRRFTEDVDLLVTPEDLKKIHDRLEGLGYVPPFAGSKHLRDTEYGVRVEFVTTGDYPGDGKPKPVAFPHPDESSIEIEGIRCMQLPKLIELKLASGMTNPGRLKDLADVQELIGVLRLPSEVASELNPFVQDKYRELWEAVQSNPAEP